MSPDATVNELLSIVFYCQAIGYADGAYIYTRILARYLQPDWRVISSI